MELFLHRSWKQVDIGSLQFLLPYYVHADKHNIIFDPWDASGNTMYVTCDGGVFKSVNAQDSDPEFQEINKGYNTTQFYGVGASRTGTIGGGTQDNGTQYNSFENNTLKSFDHVQGGDGGYFELSQLNPQVMFAALPYGEVNRSGNAGGNFTCLYDCRVDNRCSAGATSDCLPQENASFVTPFKLWEDLQTGDNVFIVGTKGIVWALNNPVDLNATPSWVRLTNNTINASAADITGGEIEALAVAEDLSPIYVGTIGGKLHRIDGLAPNINWTVDVGNPNSAGDDKWDDSLDAVTDVELTGPFGSNPITGVAVDPHDEAHIVVTLGGYFNGNHVFESFNATSGSPTFTSIHGDLPDIPVYDAVIDFESSSNIIIATEMGVWSTQDGSTWASHNEDIGTVPCFQIRQIKYHTDDCRMLYVATHGRGIWRSCSLMDASCPCYATAIDEVDNSMQATIYPNPAQNSASLAFTMATAGNVTIEVYSVDGRKVASFKPQWFGSGSNKLNVDTRLLHSGTYFVRLQGETINTTAKLLIAK